MNRINRAQIAPLLLDLAVVALAWLGAYWVRFNLASIPDAYWQRALEALPIVVVLQLAAYLFFRVQRGVWRYVSMPDLVRVFKAGVVGTLAIFVVLFLVYRLDQIPRSLPLLYLLLLLGGWATPRLIYRRLKEHAQGMLAGGERVLIVGAGQAGEYLVRDLLRNARGRYLPIAFVDDKARRLGHDVYGIPVAGECAEIPALCHSLEIDLIVLAVPSATSEQMRRLVDLCEDAGAPFRTLPPLADIVSGAAAIGELREVSLDDLLGRDPVALDWAGITAGLGRRRVLVTGAGGSIGSELCRQLARLQPAVLVLADNGEFNLYAIEHELRNAHPELNLGVYLCDVVDSVALNQLMLHYRPEVVFHAAAYKHVPLLEHQLREAIRNNVLGTRNVAEAAHRCGCSEFVLVSTDKAVNPANIMGATKRLAEIYCQNLNARSQTRFITVRFGNVLGSTGSVVPLFRQQIAAGGPVTVTHPEIERYFMTIPEACQLIMQAAVLGRGGEIFVLDMGRPVKIRDLAEQMIRMSGKKVGSEIEIRYTGLRPGEKLYEELFHVKEALQTTDHAKIFLARHREVNWEQMSAAFERIEQACTTLDSDALRRELTRLVPDYRPQA